MSISIGYGGDTSQIKEYPLDTPKLKFPTFCDKL